MLYLIELRDSITLISLIENLNIFTAMKIMRMMKICFFNSFDRQSFVIITIFSLICKIKKVNLLIKLSIVNILLFLYSFFIDLRMEEWYYFE